MHIMLFHYRDGRQKVSWNLIKNAIYARKPTIYAKNTIFVSFFIIMVAGSIYTKEAVSLTEKKYTSDGFLYVSELDRCPLFEKESAVRSCRSEDCFYCKFSDFRKREYIERVETEVRRGVLYSVCHNEKNKKRVL